MREKDPPLVVESTTFYRYDLTGRAAFDGSGLTLRCFDVERVTAKGVWFVETYDAAIRPTFPQTEPTLTGKKRFVRLVNVTKRYACPTLHEARVSFLARKRKQAQIYEARARAARDGIERMIAVLARDGQNATVTNRRTFADEFLADTEDMQF